MKQILIIPIIFQFLFMTHCSGCAVLGIDEQKATGVGQGNGMTRYVSPKFGYSISYRNSLSLTETETGDVTVDNSAVVTEEKPVSKIVIRILEDETVNGERINSQELLSQYILKLYPNTPVEEIQQPGAEGYYYESRADGALNGKYFLLTTNNDLVWVEIEAYEAANGLDWVAPIVHTFTYDAVGPEVGEFRVNEASITAGSSFELYFRASDDFSGLDLEFACGGEFNPESFKTKSDSGFYPSLIRFGYSINSHGNDLYSVSVQTDEYLPSGTYYLRRFWINDKAKNRTRLESRDEGGHYWLGSGDDTVGSQKNDIQSEMSLFRINIDNAGVVDVTPPIIREFKVISESVKAGDPFEVQVHIEDDFSGFSTDNDFQGYFDHESFTKELGQLIDIRSDNVTPLGNDWYSIKLTVNPYSRPGTYYLKSLSLSDVADRLDIVKPDLEADVMKSRFHGATGLAIPRILVINEDNIDVAPPQVSRLWAEDPVVKAGEVLQLQMEITDAVSGVRHSVGQHGYEIRPVDAKHGPLKYEHYGPLILVNGNQYSYQIKTSQYLPAGEYFLSQFTIPDNAENSFMAQAERGDTHYRHWRGRQETQLPVFTFTIVK